MRKKDFDYLIVGAGLYGSVFAHEATKQGKKCLVIDKRPHLGGNLYCEKIDDVTVHKYGAHVFHTSNKAIWDYVNQFTKFNNYINSPLANYKGFIYNLPFNMNTFYQLWGTVTPEEAKSKLAEQVGKYQKVNPKNLEEQALKLVGDDIFEIFIKHYTEKQWGRRATELPAFIIKRLPIRFTYDNNYFNDNYQGIPIGGYNQLIISMLKNTETLVNTDFFQSKNYFLSIADKIIYTGKIDEFFKYEHGELEYRSLYFQTERLATPNFQGNAVMNFTSNEVPYTRIIEHKHFEFGTQPTTIITKEFPLPSTKGNEPYYPVNDLKNMSLLHKYQLTANTLPQIIFGGRLAEYRYYDMHQIIASALSKVKQELSDN